MIHKIMAGLIDQHELAGNPQALDAPARLGDWVNWRTSRLSYEQMQAILQIEHGGIAESLTNLFRLTGHARWPAREIRLPASSPVAVIDRTGDETARLRSDISRRPAIAAEASGPAFRM